MFAHYIFFVKLSQRKCYFLIFQIEMYTRVLMGAIDLASAKLPKNTKDGAIDLVTRQYLFEKGLNFRHGTGHGIGAYLKV